MAEQLPAPREYDAAMVHHFIRLVGRTPDGGGTGPGSRRFTRSWLSDELCECAGGPRGCSHGSESREVTDFLGRDGQSDPSVRSSRLPDPLIAPRSSGTASPSANGSNPVLWAPGL